MTDTAPLISICIPTYNRADFLGGAIRSVLGQTFRNFELIVCDDGSIDRTAEIVASFSDDRIRFLQNEKNCGYIASMNRCTDTARGEWVMHLSDDDEMLPTLLEEQYAAICAARDRDIGFITCQCITVDAKSRVVAVPERQLGGQPFLILEPGEAIHNFTLYGKKIKDSYRFNTAFPSTLFRKSVLIACGKSSGRVPVAHDLLIEAKISLSYPVIFLDAPLLRYRVHENWGASVNQKGTFLNEYEEYLQLLIAYAHEAHISNIESLENMMKYSLGRYLFSFDGGAVRLAARFRGSYWSRIQILVAWMKKSRRYAPSVWFHITPYIVLMIALLPRVLLLAGGRTLKKI